MSTKKTRYVLHLHNAHRAGRHFDFRIKYLDQKKLISFAIPKEKLPYNPGEQALAIQTPDHSVGWLYREKLRIPRGEYGGGFIKRLQYGNCNIIHWTDTFLRFTLDDGPFLRGEYFMFLTKYKKKTKQKNPIWILKKPMAEGEERNDMKKFAPSDMNINSNEKNTISDFIDDYENNKIYPTYQLE